VQVEYLDEKRSPAQLSGHFLSLKMNLLVTEESLGGRGILGWQRNLVVTEESLGGRGILGWQINLVVAEESRVGRGISCWQRNLVVADVWSPFSFPCPFQYVFYDVKFLERLIPSAGKRWIWSWNL
jgi:hypothetical protein